MLTNYLCNAHSGLEEVLRQHVVAEVRAVPENKSPPDKLEENNML